MATSRRVRSLALVAALVATLSSCSGADRPNVGAGRTEGAQGTSDPSAPNGAAAAPVIEASTTTVAPPEPPTTAPTVPPTTAATVVAAASATVPLPPAPPPTAPRPPVRLTARSNAAMGDIGPYAGLGTWVDVYDWSHYRETTPTVGPDQVDAMASEGVQTLFIQTAKHDTPELISEPELLIPIIDRAHQRGLKVVAWYLPTLEDLDNDLNRLVASANLDVDGLAVDIESRKIADPNDRSARLVELSNRLRQALPGRAIGAIVMPPVQLEVVNPNFWPGFPWREIADSYDVWQTMGYWTDRKESSGYRDPYRYTDENLRRLRTNLGKPDAPVSPVGGVGAIGNGDIEAFLRAAADNGAIGGSIYDFRTTRQEAWAPLRGFRTG